MYEVIFTFNDKQELLISTLILNNQILIIEWQQNKYRCFKMYIKERAVLLKYLKKQDILGYPKCWRKIETQKI